MADEASSMFTMNCNDAVHDLYRYLDGELTEERRSVIAQHLEWCAPCGAAAHFEVELRHVIADRCLTRVPPALLERITASLGEEPDHDV